ncbi:fibrinogen-like protein 1 isoform X2 [Saccostrea echinata]|uniref:fibrinogen-like protein 1 isoform X2 n=1 Tax=Saccostrea echinata TaxID=191078 RepID=UPI002A7FB42E|nr:fibrinogen-like protein 1 isoform X2 [Saccostrea echinata]XP_061191049.1 fibrinogen-like protein 1 isoform X2 [Saccostrea echinata]
MMFSFLFLLFMPIPQVRTGSLLTGTYDPNSTALINERRDIKEIDVLRQIINQETLIRVAVVKDVRAVVDDVRSVKRSMASSETMVSTLQQTLESLKSQVDSLNRDNTLAQKVEVLQRQVYTLRQTKTLKKRVETLERQVNTLSQDNALQRKVETLQRKVDSLTEEQTREIKNWQEKNQEIEQKFNRNIAEVYELLNNRTLETIKKDLKLYVDCKHHCLQGQTQSGVYRISPFGNESQIDVYCDMVTEGGGWTAIQKRVSGSESFDRTLAEYKNGFGNANDSYWIGNCRRKRGKVCNWFDRKRNGRKRGDSMLNTGISDYNLSGMYFTTPDRDNDKLSGYNCATHGDLRGGWWFNNCQIAFLNGPWSPASWNSPWWPTVGTGLTVKETMMLIKRH